MAAAKVAVFRSDSTSPVPMPSTIRGSRQSTKMTTASTGKLSKTTNSSMLSNNGNNDPAAGLVSPGRSNNFEGITALMAACQEGRPEDVQKILKKTSSAVKERTRSRKVALHFCAESGNSPCTDLILAADPSPSLKNAQDEEGYTPLHLSVINGNKDIVRKLIAAGADLNCLDNENHSLVHWATVCGEVDILDLLLSNGAPASTPDIHSAHPIHYAAQMCGSVNGAGSVSRARVQSTVYGVSPKKGLQILKRLIQHGCPIDVRDQDGRQPLLWAGSAGSGEAILLLVNAGAKVDAEDKDGLTALHCAASRGHTDCLETLIALCGTGVDVIDNNGCSALFYAVTLGHADCTELLLNYGAEPNRQDRKGRTPAHCGAAKGQLETLKLLSKHGGNLWLRNVRGDLALHEAVLSKRKDLVMWLLSLRHESVNTPNNDGRCPIHLAALNNNVEMVKILIDHRADVNLLMRSGKGTAMTPLDAALHKGNSAVAKFLQLHGGLPSNSLNDAALHRRLNRSIEGQISPAGSLRGSNLGSNHHPSPDDHNRTFVSPDVFDHSSITPYSRTDFSNGGNNLPPFATSTPIMDDGVQTDTPYLRDMEVQVSDGFDGNVRKSGESSNGHKKSERRRRRKSPTSHSHHHGPSNSGSTSNNSSPERSSKNSTHLTSRGSKKSSRRSVKGSGGFRSKSDSHSQNSRTSEEKLNEGVETSPDKKMPDEHRKIAEQSSSPNKPSPITPQGSSDTLLDHDNTLMSEKFSELENVGVQSSETDAREEELDHQNETEENAEVNTTKTKVTPDSDNESKSPENPLRNYNSPIDKERSERENKSPENVSRNSNSPMDKERSEKENKSPENVSRNSTSPMDKERSDKVNKSPENVSRNSNSPMDKERSEKENKSPENVSRNSTSPMDKERSDKVNKSPENVSGNERSSRSKSKSKSRELSPHSRKSKSNTPVSPSPTPLRDRSASAKSTRETLNESLDKNCRSRSASADSRESFKERAKTGSDPHDARVPSGKHSSVSWDDTKGKNAPRNRSKSASEREKRSRSKSAGKDDKKRDRSKSAVERGQKSKNRSSDLHVVKSRVNTNQETKNQDQPILDKPRPPSVKTRESSPSQNHEPLLTTEIQAIKSRSATKSPKSEGAPRQTSDDVHVCDEIEAGKTINLQEAARRRSESLARDPSRCRPISISRHSCNESFNEISNNAPKKVRGSKTKPVNRSREVPTTSEEREIQLQEALLASSNKLRPDKKVTSTTSEKSKRSLGPRQSLKKSRIIRKSSEELHSNSTVVDSGFSDHRVVTTSTSEELRTRLSPPGKPLNVKRRVAIRRPGSSNGSASGHNQTRKSIFSSSPKQYRIPNVKDSRYDTVIMHQMSIENGVLEDEIYSSSTRDSVTSEDAREQSSPRRKKTNYSRPRSGLTFSRNDNIRLSPRPKKGVDVETPISVTQAMQASMRKYNLERMIFHELLELKRVQVRAGKANEQLLVKRLAENYKRAGFSVNFRDFEGPFTFRNFEKYLYDQLRLLQNNRKVLPRFAPSDDIEKLSTALKKMNSAKLPYLEDAERSESVCDNIQCSHTTHRCHHAAHAYTGVPCAAYIGNRKPTFLPRVNPLKAPGPTQKDPTTRNLGTSGTTTDAMNLNSPMQISITPRTDTQSPITLEVQQGLSTQVFTLPTKTLDPSKNYYVSLSIKPNPTTTSSGPSPRSENLNLNDHPSPGDVLDDGSISAPPPPVHGVEVKPDADRDKHNRSM